MFSAKFAYTARPPKDMNRQRVYKE